jgi:hypothetical protein
LLGDNTQFGYQLMSPPVPLRPSTTYLFRVRYTTEEGRVCAGILTGDQQRWVVPPDGATVEFRFDSNQLDAARVVIANCHVADSGYPRSRITLSGGSYGVIAAPQ